MLNSLQRRFWLVGSVVGLSLLGACAPEDESASISEVGTVDQELALKNLEVSLSSDKATFGASESALVNVTLRNGTAKTAKLLKKFTLADGVEEPLFAVTRDGAAVDYLGPHIKRGPVSEEDYLTLKSGESQTWTMDLAQSYDLSKTGTYNVRFAVGPVQSIELKLAIEGRPSGTRAPPPDVTIQGIAFSRCDATQQGLVTQALSGASNYANAAVTYLNGTPSATPRYTTWFGTYSSSGWNTAKNHFIAIKDVYDTKTVTVDCSCRKKYYAYVYPNQPYNIYVCNVFWQAPTTGTDSKAGTLIHETSHFTVVAGTNDNAYGQSACRSLAISDPTKALNNADSHEYFAENTPAQQ